MYSKCSSAKRDLSLRKPISLRMTVKGHVSLKKKTGVKHKNCDYQITGPDFTPTLTLTSSTEVPGSLKYIVLTCDEFLIFTLGSKMGMGKGLEIFFH